MRIKNFSNFTNISYENKHVLIFIANSIEFLTVTHRKLNKIQPPVYQPIFRIFPANRNMIIFAGITETCYFFVSNVDIRLILRLYYLTGKR